MKKYISVLIFVVIFISCEKEYSAPIPKLTWDLFESTDAIRIAKNSLEVMEGVYSVTDGSDVFGNEVVIKYTYNIENNDTNYYVSVLCETDNAFFICQGKYIDSTILLYGYWRKLIGSETGTVRLTISAEDGAGLLLNGDQPLEGNVRVEGVFGEGENIPEKQIVFIFNRLVNNRNSFQILAHRGGGRTSDLLSASENSIELIHKSTQFGSTGVEIDVRLTSDGIPILYHDNTLNLRLIKPSGLNGPIENYSYAQLSGLVRLINGEKIPTLREALETIVYQTCLEFVWMDIKYTGPLQIIRDLQEEFLQKAVTAGRDVQLLIGLPANEQKDYFMQLPNYTSIPSICELSLDEARTLNSSVWAPRWTLDVESSDINLVHSEGRKCITWTMDVPQYIEQYINEIDFDGMLTNYPSVVAYYEYVK